MLSDNIKRIRKFNKLSQEELAKKADITYSTLIKIESGVNVNPTIRTLEKISQALKVTVDELIKKSRG